MIDDRRLIDRVSSVMLRTRDGGLTFDAGDAHAVDDVVREAERNALGDLERPTLRVMSISSPKLRLENL